MTHPRQAFGPDAWAEVSWRVSSYSDSFGGNCVEAGALRDTTGQVAVRHSHRPQGLAVLVGQRGWACFVDGVKNDEFAS